MKILNLVNSESSDIKYKINKFPDGQQQITIDFEDIDSFELEVKSENSGIEIFGPVEIKSRLNNFQDLELIICATKSLRNLGVKEIHLYTPYFLGSRSDRQFEEGSNNYLKDVICPIINNLNFESITVIDPHSNILEACLNNFKKLDNSDLVKWVLMNEPFCTKSLKEIVLISPDAGASHKIHKLAEKIDYKGDIITCTKERGVDGKLTHTDVPSKLYNDDLYEGKDLVIIDDIGDRFGTFINIAKVIKERYRLKNKLYLIVTHSIQEEGIKEALKYFDSIYTTNSVNDFKIEGLKQLNLF